MIIQDPIKFNYLLHLWDVIQKDLVEESIMQKLEQELSQHVRAQSIIEQMKKEFGCI